MSGPGPFRLPLLPLPDAGGPLCRSCSVGGCDGKGGQVPPGYRCVAEDKRVGGEMGPVQVAFEGWEVVPSHGRVCGVGVVVQVAVGEPGSRSQRGEGRLGRGEGSVLLRPRPGCRYEDRSGQQDVVANRLDRFCVQAINWSIGSSTLPWPSACLRQGRGECWSETCTARSIGEVCECVVWCQRVGRQRV